MNDTTGTELIKRLEMEGQEDDAVGRLCLEARDALEAAERKRAAAYKRGYREAYDSGLKALADMGVEFTKLAMSVQEHLDLVKDSAAELVDIVEGRACSATSLLDVPRPDDTAELCMFHATGQRKGGDE